ncbi:hypothetical protein Cgig2_004927 [Carnegiea gigantea]|uniref:Exostosin GT47 domain-containing protein n=1 Tax=Carnegiea gigantea TaxID=171969 RepID=A0A9Q1KXF1_9CARY|nr:hypothetical protein Cgig2_004927 [Carnegiea gigantea]
MGMNKHKSWLVIISLFTMWSLLICLNHSSLLDSVTSLAKFYIYSINYQEPILIISDQSNSIHTNITISIKEKTEGKTRETEAKAKETGGKRRQVRHEEVIKFANVNIVDHKVTNDQPIKEAIVLKEKVHEIPQQIMTLRRRRRRGRSRRKSNVSLLKPSPPPPPPPRECKTNRTSNQKSCSGRMKQYDCLTNDSSIASAIFVPFYVGLDLARHLWNTDSEVRDSGGFELIKWLKRKPEWKKWRGRDHFFVAGRITWDFRRSSNKNDPDWGTEFLYLPESKNMTALVIESSPWNNNDFGIPYPTYFHPANDDQVFQWQEQMRTQRRRYLFCFAGAPRPDRPDSIRNQLITQCENSKQCMLIHCNNWKNKCHKPAELMKMFQNSIFCLQPPGDSYTRRSTFDSILAGCIPVFFHPGSAYIQYLWHFPREFTKYSVFISMYDIKDGKVSIERTLERIPPRKVQEMREEIISLIPKIVYADPRCRLETLEDAFDVAVKGILERVKRIKDDMREGRNDSFAYDERQAWKYRWLGKLEEHEWDRYFSGSSDTRNFTNF